MAVSSSADARWFSQRGAGYLMGWIESAMSDPLASCEVWRQQEKLSENLNSRNSSDSRYADQEIKTLTDTLITTHQKQSLAAKFMDMALNGSERTL